MVCQYTEYIVNFYQILLFAGEQFISQLTDFIWQIKWMNPQCFSFMNSMKRIKPQYLLCIAFKFINFLLCQFWNFEFSSQLYGIYSCICVSTGKFYFSFDIIMFFYTENMNFVLQRICNYMYYVLSNYKSDLVR